MVSHPSSHAPHPPLQVSPPPPTFRDPASHSHPGVHFTDHIHLDLHLDLEVQTIHATATYEIRILDRAAPFLTFDVRGLDIHSVTACDKSSTTLQYTLEKADSPIGGALRIALPEALRDSSTLNLSISYTTSGLGGGHSAGGALGWLSPSQTSSGAPFAFTQAQVIHARSIVPCQDTPAVKATYSALISLAGPHDALTVVMSAQRVPARDGDRPGAARFDCAVPVPSYLLAFACGRLDVRELSDRCCVWAEPGVVEKAAWEFDEVEKMVQAAEKIAGPYVWGRYDLLVLPGSFPYGGMENPFLTFVTPTLLSGDRSLVSVVAHEIAHSWSGNLVSCQDSRHFWVNEGFTVKLERRILRELYGSGREGLEAIAGRQALESFIKSVGVDHKYTSLVTKLQDEEDPDDYFSCVSYEKGYNFLLCLEHSVEEEGAGDFHEFLKKYFDKYRYQSITSSDFVNYFRNTFPNVAESIDFEEWLHGVGGCPVLAPVDTSLVEEAAGLARELLTVFKQVEDLSDDDALSQVREKLGSRATGFREWDPKQKLCFLTEIRADIENLESSGEELVWNERSAKCLQDLFHLDSIRNSEIRFAWCRLALLARYSEVLDNVKDFLSTQGRMKFIRPLFNDLNNVHPKGNYAKDLFSSTRDSYHSIACKMIERDLSLNSP